MIGILRGEEKILAPRRTKIFAPPGESGRFESWPGITAGRLQAGGGGAGRPLDAFPS